jgi:hypothetical protein
MVKKVLITGMNREQCVRDYFLKKELKILSSHYSLIRCLEDMGYEVEQRPVTIGENLDHYDEVIVYLHSIQSFCQHLYDGLYAIKARPNAILAFDDWQVDQVIGSYPQYKRNLEDEERYNPFRQYLIDLYYGDSDVDTIKAHKQDYKDACDIIMSNNNRLMVCAYAGGDLSRLNVGWKEDRIFSFNPNPYNLNRRPENNYGEEGGIASFFGVETTEPEDKQRAWVFSSLIQNKTSKWLKNQNLQWELLSYGARRGEHKSSRVTEPEMCKVYNKNWGCLMPAYYHAGSGWWRSRVQQTIDAGSILYCEDAEGKIYGDAFIGLNTSDIEQMDMSQLVDLAARQKECLYDNHPLDKSVERAELTKILES